jgi:hypothetical protein
MPGATAVNPRLVIMGNEDLWLAKEWQRPTLSPASTTVELTAATIPPLQPFCMSVREAT